MPVMPNKDAYGFQDKADLQLLFKLELIGWNRSPNYRRKKSGQKGGEREAESESAFSLMGLKSLETILKQLDTMGKQWKKVQSLVYVPTLE